MTRYAGQITTRQAVLGGIAILAVAVGIVAALTFLLERDEQLRPLEAPAEPEEPAAEQACPSVVAPQTLVTSEDLIECPDVHNGVVLRYRGEAVRAVLPRGDRAWVHLNDDAYALDLGPLPGHRTAVGGNSGIPVFIPIDVAERIRHVGDGHHRGDIIDITGTFLRAHPADDGGPAIHAHTARIQETGTPIDRTTSRPRLTVALVIIALGSAATAAAHLKPTRRP